MPEGAFYKGKKVLVTGGAGFVGTHFVQELLRRGAQVRVTLHRRPLIAQDPRIETVQADLTQLAHCRRAMAGIQYVFHAAGAVSSAGETAVGQMSAITHNLILTATCLHGAWHEGVERFQVFSSSTAYPAADHPVREEEMWSGPTYPAYFGYGWMRRYLERLSEFVASRSEMMIALVRPSAVYGRWDNFDPVAGHVIPARIRSAVHKQDPYVVWGTGNEVRDFLHITDLVRGCLLMLEKYATCDPVNIGYGRTATIREIVEIILRAAGHEGAEVRFDTSKPTTIPFRLVNTSKARQLIGFEPQVTLEEGLADTVRWYMETPCVHQR